jgi:hypothetical protein
MKIRKFQFGKADESGELPVEMVLAIQNTADVQARRLSVQTVLSDASGFPFAFSVDTDEAFIAEPGEAIDWVLPSTTVNAPPSARDAGALVGTSATLHARELFRLGEVDVPRDERGTATIEKAIHSAVLESPVRVTVMRNKVDDEGTCRISCWAAVRNNSSHRLESVELKAELLDASEDVIETNSDARPVQPRSSSCIDGGTPWVEESKLRSAKLRLSLIAYRPIMQGHCASPTC